MNSNGVNEIPRETLQNEIDDDFVKVKPFYGRIFSSGECSSSTEHLESEIGEETEEEEEEDSADPTDIQNESQPKMKEPKEDIPKEEPEKSEEKFFNCESFSIYRRISENTLFLKNRFDEEVVAILKYGGEHQDLVFSIKFNPKKNYKYIYRRTKVEFFECHVNSITILRNDDIVEIFVEFTRPPRISSPEDSGFKESGQAKNDGPGTEETEGEEEEEVKSEEMTPQLEFEWGGNLSAKKENKIWEDDNRWLDGNEIQDGLEDLTDYPSYYKYKKKRRRKRKKFEEEEKDFDFLSTCNNFPLGFGYSDFFSITISRPEFDQKKFKRRLKDALRRRYSSIVNKEVKDNLNLHSLQLRVSEECNYLRDYKYIQSSFRRMEKDGDFDILYLLECCLSRNLIIRENLSKSFLEELNLLTKEEKFSFLKRMVSQIEKKLEKGFRRADQYLRKFDPLESLNEFKQKLQDDELQRIRKELGVEFMEIEGDEERDNFVVKGVTISPTKVTVNIPRIDCGNHVLRKYPKYVDRFLRVKFLDDSNIYRKLKNANTRRRGLMKREEKREFLSTQESQVFAELSRRFPRTNTKFKKLIKHLLLEGFQFHDRKYNFFLYSESQLRSGSIWMFCDQKRGKRGKRCLTAKKIREEIGEFRILSNPTLPKRATRMGLVLSASVGTERRIEDDEYLLEKDVERNEYVFTDGCGMICEDLMLEIFCSSRLKNLCRKDKDDMSSSTFVSAVQMRCKGFKGMLVVVSRKFLNYYMKKNRNRFLNEEVLGEEEEDRMKRIQLIFRKSQKKFETRDKEFDICHAKWSKFHPLFLNREIIMNLEARDMVHCCLNVLYDDDEDEEEIVDSEEEGEEEEEMGNRMLEEDRILSGEISKKKASYFERNEEEIRKVFQENAGMGRRNQGQDGHPRPSQRILSTMKEMIKDLDRMSIKKEEPATIRNLQTFFGDRKAISRTITRALKHANFKLSKEPFLSKCVTSLSRSMKRLILTKNNIYVNQGARFFGISDPTGILEQNEIFCVIAKPILLSYPQKFKRKELQQKVLIVKNPAVHVGDARICRAVSQVEIKERMKKKLKLEKEERVLISNFFKRMENVIVFSTKGDRPLFHKMSGSDLDGDEFAIIYDKKMVFPIRKNEPNFKPLEYDKFNEVPKTDPLYYNEESFEIVQNYYSKMEENEKESENGEETKKEFFKNEPERLIDYWLKYQSMFNLGEISNLIYSFYGKSVLGLLHPIARTLGIFHSLSVDSTKYGEEIWIPKELRISQRPEFLLNSVCEKRFKSKNLCGEIFRWMKEEIREKRREKKEKEQLIFSSKSSNLYEKEIEIDPEIVDLEKMDQVGGNLREYFVEFLEEAKYLHVLYIEQIQLLCSQYSLSGGESQIFSRSYKYLRKSKSISIRSLDISIQFLFRKFREYMRKTCFEKAKTIFGFDKNKRLEENEKDMVIKMKKMLMFLKTMAWYYVCYKKNEDDQIGRYMGMVWLVHEELCEIKKDKIGKDPKKLLQIINRKK